ncbi:hypothetical protein ACFL3F_03170 [Planctomycetota bacterium]
MTTQNNDSRPIDYQSLVNDIRHELEKVYHLNMHPALVLDTIDILINEQTGLACVADNTERHDPGTEGLHIDPPPREDGLFRVIYIIDVNANDAKAAAQETHETMIDPDSLAPVLHVLDSGGHETTIDLSQE